MKDGKVNYRVTESIDYIEKKGYLNPYRNPDNEKVQGGGSDSATKKQSRGGKLQSKYSTSNKRLAEQSLDEEAIEDSSDTPLSYKR
jgi:hypothetical protein